MKIEAAVRKNRSGFLLLVALSLLAIPRGAVAQGDSILVRGTVTDALTGEPLGGVEVRVVEAPGLGAVTASDGVFTVVGDADFPLTIRSGLLGYENSIRRVPAHGATLRIELEPEPLLLEGLEVVADRFDQRLRAIPRRTRVLRRGRIISSNAVHGIQVIEQRWGFREVPCSRRLYTERSRCYSAPHHSGPFELWIDDMRRPVGGLEELAAIRPEDIWRIELIGSREIRVYTEAFVERQARLAPIVRPPEGLAPPPPF